MTSVIINVITPILKGNHKIIKKLNIHVNNSQTPPAHYYATSFTSVINQ